MFGPIGWLVTYGLVSLAAAFLVERVFVWLISLVVRSGSNWVIDAAVNAARVTIFVGVWSAITVSAGMRGFNKGVRRLRRRVRLATGRLDALTKGEEIGGSQ